MAVHFDVSASANYEPNIYNHKGNPQMALPRKMRALRGIRDIGWFESNESRYI